MGPGAGGEGRAECSPSGVSVAEGHDFPRGEAPGPPSASLLEARVGNNECLKP